MYLFIWEGLCIYHDTCTEVRDRLSTLVLSYHVDSRIITQFIRLSLYHCFSPWTPMFISTRNILYYTITCELHKTFTFYHCAMLMVWAVQVVSHQSTNSSYVYLLSHVLNHWTCLWDKRASDLRIEELNKELYERWETDQGFFGRAVHAIDDGMFVYIGCQNTVPTLWLLVPALWTWRSLELWQSVPSNIT